MSKRLRSSLTFVPTTTTTTTTSTISKDPVEERQSKRQKNTVEDAKAAALTKYPSRFQAIANGIQSFSLEIVNVVHSFSTLVCVCICVV